MAQKDKIFCLSHSISQKLYLIWLWFFVHLCKMIISPGVFFIFFFSFHFDFLGSYGGKRAKNSPNWKNIVSFALHISGIMHHIIVIHSTLVWNNDISRQFFQFFKMLIFWVVGGVKGPNIVQNEEKLYLLCSISQETYII